MTKINASKKWGRYLSAAFCAALSLWSVLTQSAALAADEDRPVIIVPRGGGAQIWHNFGCWTCHRLDGSGGKTEGGPASNLHETKLTRDELIQVIANGRLGMPPYKGIIDASTIETIATWIKEGLKQ